MKWINLTYSWALSLLMMIALAGLAPKVSSTQHTQSMQHDRVSVEGLLEALEILRRRGGSQAGLIKAVRQRGVEFKLSKALESELRNAGATEDLLDAIRRGEPPPSPSPITSPSSSPTPSPIVSPTPSPTVSTTTGPTRPSTVSPMPLVPAFRNQIGMELVLIKPGRFQMGSATISSDEKPVHTVTIGSGFYMGKYEVTIAEWEVMMHDLPPRMSGFEAGFQKSKRQPVVGVSWHDAQRFINRLNESDDKYTYSLPSEAEWEYACRGGTSGDYAGNLNSMAWYARNSANYTHEVGTAGAGNDFGLFDMHGNALEWCSDAYHENYIGAPTDGSSWSSGDKTGYGVLRGGSWRKDAGELRSAYRRKSVLTADSDGMGLRVVARIRK